MPRSSAKLRSVETLREKTVRLSDGAMTTVQQWGERGPLVVGVHGVGGSRRGWTRLAEYLAPRLRFAAYDQRGHGDTSANAPMTLARSVADLRDVVVSLGEPVHALIGHSWGGAVVVVAGRELDVARVVALDPMLRLAEGLWSANVLTEYRRLSAQTPADREAAIRTSYAALPQVELDAKLHATRRWRLGALVAIGTDNRIDDGDWDLHPLIRDYPKPLLLALADPKRSALLEEERDEIRAAGCANVRIEVFPGASHSLQRDAFERVAPVLEAFLSA
ncbi:MAG: alpha/beta hydrolase [Candidatus Elarobacter sp.]